MTAHGMQLSRSTCLQTSNSCARSSLTHSSLSASIEARRVAEAEIETARAQMRARDEQLRRVQVAHRSLLVETLQRLLQRETDRARKHQVTREKFVQWLDTFYQVHADVCRDALRPVITAWLNGDNADKQLSAFVAEWVATSERELRDVADERHYEQFAADLNRVLQRWDTHRASDTADRVLREGLHHARS